MNQLLFHDGLRDLQGPSLEARKAALLYHSMTPKDRGWLLSRLSGAQSRELEHLHRELEELGIPADGEFLKGMISAKGPGAPRESPPFEGTDPGALLSRLRQVEPGMMARVLEGEPVQLVVDLLAVEAWPWSHSVLDSLHGAARAEVLRCLAEGTRRSGGARERTLIQLVWEKCQTMGPYGQGEDQAVLAPRKGWSSMFQPFARVLGRTKASSPPNSTRSKATLT